MKVHLIVLDSNLDPLRTATIRQGGEETAARWINDNLALLQAEGFDDVSVVEIEPSDRGEDLAEDLTVVLALRMDRHELPNGRTLMMGLDTRRTGLPRRISRSLRVLRAPDWVENTRGSLRGRGRSIAELAELQFQQTDPAAKRIARRLGDL